MKHVGDLAAPLSCDNPPPPTDSEEKSSLVKAIEQYYNKLHVHVIVLSGFARGSL